MEIIGVVAEFDPFHNGHAHLLSAAHALGDTVAVVMSGHVTQRGETALLDKWSRTRAALRSGADIVLELPAVWACASAEGFARAGIGLLSAFGCHSFLFGSECGDIARLRALAKAADDPLVTAHLRAQLRNGLSYAAALQSALDAACPGLASLDTPNDILGVEYLRAAKGTGMTGHTIRRVGASHDGSAVGEYASGSMLRSCLLTGQDIAPYVPDSTVYEHARLCFPQQLERPMLLALRSLSLSQWQALPGAGDGLAERLYRAAGEARSLEELFTLAKTKRHALSRIRRTALCGVLGLDRSLRDSPLPYLRILGMNQRGAAALSQIKPALPMSTSLAGLRDRDGHCRAVAEAEVRATGLFGLGCADILPRGVDFTEKAVIIKEEYHERHPV